MRKLDNRKKFNEQDKQGEGKRERERQILKGREGKKRGRIHMEKGSEMTGESTFAKRVGDV